MSAHRESVPCQVDSLASRRPSLSKSPQVIEEAILAFFFQGMYLVLEFAHLSSRRAFTKPVRYLKHRLGETDDRRTSIGEPSARCMPSRDQSMAATGRARRHCRKAYEFVYASDPGGPHRHQPSGITRPHMCVRSRVGCDAVQQGQGPALLVSVCGAPAHACRKEGFFGVSRHYPQRTTGGTPGRHSRPRGLAVLHTRPDRPFHGGPGKSTMLSASDYRAFDECATSSSGLVFTNPPRFHTSVGRPAPAGS